MRTAVTRCLAATRSGWVWAAVLLLAPVGPVAAQLSPGPLSRPHSQLEGSAHCLDCHQSRKGVDAEKCLGCHELLAARVRVGEGLHGRPDYADCKTCHIDHHGLEFELVWWGDEGQAAFDHELTGHRLEGAHQSLECRECHRTEHVLDAARLRRHGKDPMRTFLGLGTECLSCHQDEHRGQLAGRSCESCHSQESWRPAARFDHQAARFTLTGRHRDVGCPECHAEERDSEAMEAGTFVRFAPVAWESCRACHQDPHQARFGPDCESCHQTSGWLVLDDDAFDHRLTRYPLEGRHRDLRCGSCHRAGEPRRGIAFAACRDCHEDEHAGQLARRADGGDCASCHDLAGFTPARYTRAEHQEVFALEGGHQEVACEACHPAVARGELVRQRVALPSAGGSSELTLQLRFSSNRCSDCHEDPHDGASVGLEQDQGCQSCHRVDAWSDVAFQHGETGFELDLRHVGLSCRECHAPEAGEGEDSAMVFKGLGRECASCHADPHQGQFEEPAGGVAGCERCHGTGPWRPADRFDHARDATFALEGAHQGVSCLDCHRRESGPDGPFTRFRPLSHSCRACHGAGG